MDLFTLQSDFTGRAPEDISNIGTTFFCPLIDMKRRGYMHRKAPTGQPKPNHAYHYWQTNIGELIQYCSVKKDPEYSIELCETHFKLCPEYRERYGLETTPDQLKQLERIRAQSTCKTKKKTKKSTLSSTKKVVDDSDEEDDD
jgi:hypothetical protein